MIDKELIHQAAEDIDIFQADLIEEYDRLMEARKKPRRRLRLWPLAAAACVAGIIAIFLAPPRTSEEQPPLALEEPIASSQEPRVESQESRVESQESRVESQESRVTGQESRVKGQESRVESQESRVESQKITVTSRRPKAKSQRPKAKSQQPIAEPMLAEAEIERGALPEMEDPLLAVAAQIQDIRSRGERLGREIAQLTDNKIKYQ